MKLLIARHKTAQRTEAIVLLDRNRPFFRQVVCNSTGWIVLEAFESAGVIGIENWIVDEVPSLQMHADYRPNLGRDALRLPVAGVHAEFKVHSVKQLAVVGMRTDEEF